MRRILFVDDEPKILEGLQRMLRSQRREWQMEFASGGPAALAACESSPFDVVVTDMRMPGMDGAMLLAEVQERYPATVRIVLSGHTEREAASRAVRVAHQFLMKPCSTEILKSVIDRACGLRDLLMDETLRSVVGQIDSLPAVPSLYAELTEVLTDPDASPEEVTRVLARDMSMSAKLLQLVNSSFFGVSREVSSLETAVGLLGNQMVRQLTLSAEALQSFGAHGVLEPFVERLHRHSSAVADLAARIVPERQLAQDAYVSGMLHDIGKLVLADRLPDRFLEVTAEAEREGLPVHVVEKRALGVTHAEIGAYLLGLWNLPFSIMAAAAFHHRPGDGESGRFDALAAVHVADALVHEIGGGDSEVSDSGTLIDEEYLASLGVLDQLPGWRALAEQTLREA